VSPAVGAAAGLETVVITGTDLDNASEVDFDGVVGTIVSGSDTTTQVAATVPPNTLGTVDVTVTTPGGTSSDSTADQFTGIAAPAVSGVDPSIGPTTVGTDVIIYGTDLDGATAVDFGQTAGKIDVDAGSYILAESPAGSAGTVNVTVTTPYGTSLTSTADQFTYVAPPTTVATSYSVVTGTTLNVSAADGVLANDRDPQGLPLSATLLTNTTDGTLALGSDGSFTYTPNSGYFGPDSFMYEASNGYADSNPTTVSITVSPVTLSWPEGVTGTWMGRQWGAGSSYPDNTDNASVAGSGSVVNVTSDQSANALAVQSGAEVAVGPGAVLFVTTDTSVTGGSTLSVDPSGLFSTGGTFTLDPGSSVTGGPVFAAAYQLDDGTASANLSGPGGVTKDTSGTVMLSGDNSYSGGTVVNDGTLIVANASALPVGSSLTVGAGASMLFAASQAAPSFSPAGVATPAANVAAASATSTPIVAAGALTNSSLTASAVPIASPFLHGRVGNLSYGPIPARVAKDATSVATPPAMSMAAIDTVFTSQRSAFDRTGSPADRAQFAASWAWLANSSDRNQKTDPTAAALATVLARFGV
jgi:autotransporter-associated beta strand protein